MTILSLTDIGSVRDQVRMNALESFEFFTNSILTAQFSEATCALVQEAVDAREDAVFVTKCPRGLAVALFAWLSSHGVQVVTSAKLPEQEVLRWLDLLGEQRDEENRGALIDVFPDRVCLRWV